MKQFIHLFILILIGVTPAAFAESWIQVEGDRGMIDETSIVQTGNQVIYWARETYDPRTRHGKLAEFMDDGLRTEKTQFVLDCTRKTFAVKASEEINEKTRLKTRFSNSYLLFTPFDADPVLARRHQYVCNKTLSEASGPVYQPSR